MTTTQNPAGPNVARLAHDGLGRPAGSCYDRSRRVLPGGLLAAVAVIGLVQ